ncbi:hypothetical protein AYI70_g12029 [Smittium culicis]|uniref:Uncharacterized protein n=1 Tax=Smittium culicis TaxID=133412 RepID=A0A1R1WZ87_9FUNG|nr:hypothetical protein AYI70_g12029 [Smittium culicis]
MWRHCISYGTRIQIQYVPFIVNPEDALSRLTMQTEWSISEKLFHRIQKYFGPHDIDIQDECIQPQLDRVDESIHVSAVESDPAHHPEDPSGEDHSDSDHAVLEISPVVSGPEGPVNCTANQDSSVSSHPRSEKRKISDNAQLDMVAYDLAVMRARYQEAGLDGQAKKLILDNTRVKTKQKKYLNPKNKFILWISNSSISIENVAAIEFINYLEIQPKTLNWRLGASKNYKSTILNLNSG